MLISHKLKCIFIHIPKAAGSSMDKLLQHNDPSATRIIADLPATHIAHKGKHCFATDLKEYLPDNIWRSYFKFAFVRNPFDRLVSWYHMCLQKPDEEYRQYIVQNTTSFEDFIIKSDNFPGRAKMLSFNQVEYICDQKGNLLVDFIGYFENIDSDFNKVTSALGIKNEITCFNRSEHKNYREYYSDKTINIVNERFHKDLVRFSYAY